MKYTKIKIVISLLLSICFTYSCSTFKIIHEDGSKYVVFSARSDAYKKNKSMSNARLKSFDLNMVNAPTDSLLHKRVFEELSANDLKSISYQNNKTAVLFWYTDCPTTTYQTIALSNRLRAAGIATVLISLEYAFENMDNNLHKAKYFFNSYILPNNYSKYLISKQINYIKELDPSYYDLYKDDVMEINCMILDKEGKVKKSYTRNQIDLLKDENLLVIINNL